MRNESHTFIGALRDAIEAWRKENGWSRETVVMAILEAHISIDAETTTGIVFDPQTRDTFERAKVNADRVFRWLDDVTKDSNTCPANFIPSILAALPVDRRLALVNRWLMPLGISCRSVNEKSLASEVQCFKGLVLSAASAQSAVANLLDGVDPGELEQAQEALCGAQRSISATLGMVEAKIRGHQ